MAYTPITRLYVQEDLRAEARLALSRDHSHYLLSVMRKKDGDEIALFNGRDGEWLACVSVESKRSALATLVSQRRPQQDEPDLALFFAPIKRTRLDFIAQKATELGVSLIQPVMTDRTIVDRVNTDRLIHNAIEAAEQSERLTIPIVKAPLKLPQALKDWPDNRALLFCDESLEGKPIAEAAKTLTTPRAAILIGPEGGFTDAERSAINALPQAVAVTLGPRILRADTAALSSLSVYQALRGDWS